MVMMVMMVTMVMMMMMMMLMMMVLMVLMMTLMTTDTVSCHPGSGYSSWTSRCRGSTPCWRHSHATMMMMTTMLVSILMMMMMMLTTTDTVSCHPGSGAGAGQVAAVGRPPAGATRALP
jgi:hypothetical protein